ncbi:MAG: hypothetical protein ACYTF6_12030 [Planctomycetota bacterium]|jgi:hypothetical protein
MTVAVDTLVPDTHVPNGVDTVFAFTFPAQENLDVAVYLDSGAGYQLVDRADFTVSLNAPRPTPVGGTVTFTVAPTGTSLLITRDSTLDQRVNWEPYRAFVDNTHEYAVDRLTLIFQEMDYGGPPA